MMVWFISLILAVTIFLLVTEKVPIDVAAIGLLVVVVAAGVLTPSEALRRPAGRA